MTRTFWYVTTLLVTVSNQSVYCRSYNEHALLEVYRKWHQHLDLLSDTDFGLVEPIMALRSSVQETLLTREADPGRKSVLGSSYSSHLMELCRLARAAGNTQVRIYDAFFKKILLQRQNVWGERCFRRSAGGEGGVSDEAAEPDGRGRRHRLGVAAGGGTSLLGKEGTGTRSGVTQADDR